MRRTARQDPSPRPPLTLERTYSPGVGLTEQHPIHTGLVASQSPTKPEWDMHYAVELGVVMSGRMRRLWRSCQTDLSPGQVWYCGIWERHGWQVLEAPCDHLVLVILPEVLLDPALPTPGKSDFLAPFRLPPHERPQPDGVTRQQVLAIAQHIVPKLNLPVPMRQLWVRVLTLELLMLLHKDWPAPTQQVPATPDALESLAAAIDLVFSTRRLLTTREAAAACGMSVSTFRQSFRSATGISFAKFALRHRVWGAAAQLLRGSDTLATVAAAWGFTDDSHLHHCFLRHYGCPPGAYRRRQSAAAARAPRKTVSNSR